MNIGAEGSLQCAWGCTALGCQKGWGNEDPSSELTHSSLGNKSEVRGGTWQNGEQKNTNSSGLEMKLALCSVEGGHDGVRLAAWGLLSSHPWRLTGDRSAYSEKQETARQTLILQGKHEASSCHHVKTGRNTLRHMWCLSRAISAWGLWINSTHFYCQLAWSSRPAHSWTAAGMETYAKAAEAQSGAWCVAHTDTHLSA